MKPLNWVELTRQQIKARHSFGWLIQGIEKQNKVLTKIVYIFSTGGRTTVLTDIEWNTNNSKKIQDLIIEFETLMEERHVDLKKAYELIVGNKVFTDKKNIIQERIKSWAEKLIDLSGKKDLISYRDAKTISITPSSEIQKRLTDSFGYWWISTIETIYK